MVRRYEAEPFARGSCDCMSLCADAIQAITGNDAAGHVRGKYANKREALNLLRKLDVAGPVEIIEGLFPRVDAAMLQRGDFAYFPAFMGERLAAPALVTGTHAITMTRQGLVALPMNCASHGWAV